MTVPDWLTPSERGRYATLVQTLRTWRRVIDRDHQVLDYGSSWGTSTMALLEIGVHRVVGVDVDAARVAKAVREAPADRVTSFHVPDTRRLPFADHAFRTILANAVFEHIPQPRDQHLRELWRVLAPGGHLIINETPNSLYPIDLHTTGLWGNHWLPSRWAKARAIRRGRWDPARRDWASSGWRGVRYGELRRALPRTARLVPEISRTRHRVLSWFGLPPNWLDPYPTWVFQKEVA